MGVPHVLVIPYPVQGHVIPLMELSLFLAKHGIKITFVNTEQNHNKIVTAFPHPNVIEKQITLVSLSNEEGTQVNGDKPGNSTEALLSAIPSKLRELIDCINGSESEMITCVLADQSIGWVLDIAEKKGIHRASFCPAAAAQLVIGFSIQKLIDSGIIDKDGSPIGKQIIRLSASMPLISNENLVWVCLGNLTTQKHIFELMMRNNKSLDLVEWFLCNSAYELEPATFNLSSNIIPIGPLLARNRLGHSVGNFWKQDMSCLQWLDQQSPKSVIYIAFGSFTSFDPIQFQELALGLELCNRPFLWVVKQDMTYEGKAKGFYPEGFPDRVTKQGKIVGWAPQQEILGHPSVSCFISHCGWNSTVEGVSNGVPILCWPHIADQFLNQSYVCDVWRTGIRLERSENGIITRSEIKCKIDQLLSDDNISTRALDLKEKVAVSTGEGGSSGKNLRDFIEWIKKLSADEK